MTRRTFSHLTKSEIKEIVVSHARGESCTEIAAKLAINTQTVSYHLKKHQNTYEEENNVYAVVKAEYRSVCIHPSLKCSLCGTHKDLVLTEERQEKFKLQARLKRANERLQVAGLPIE